MKIALPVIRITSDINANISSVVNTVHKCAKEGADLIVYPEASITGLINNDNPAYDLPLGQPIPGPFTDTLGNLTKEHSIHLSIGILEREGNRLYDTAILLTPDGEIALKYRRINLQWHSEQADPNIYCEGKEVKKAKTALGTFTFLICGDFFDDNLVARVRKLQSDWLIVPFARCFDDGTYDQIRWDNEEKFAYIERVKLAETTTFMVNYIADKGFDGGSFGGAMVVSREGRIIKELPIGIEDILYVEVL